MIWKNYKILIWIFFVAISVAVVVNLSPNGFKIDYIKKNVSISDLTVGDVIYSINDREATRDDFERDYYGNIKLETNKGMKFVKANGSLGLSVSEQGYSNLNFGLDLKGGIRVLVQPNTTSNETMEQTISTLQTRINIYGLRETSFRSIWYEKEGFIEISMAGGTEEELKELLEHQGKFEAKIPLAIEIKNNTGEFELDKKYQFYVEGNSLRVDDKTIKQGEEFVLAGIPFLFENITDKINLTSKVYTGKDIVTVFFDPQRSRIEKLDTGYSWSFLIQISNDGAQRFAWVTQNIPRRIEYLESQIYLYLDDKLIDALNIASTLKGKAETTIMIQGGADTLDEAKNERAKLQSILRSGALPTSIEIVKMDTISPNLGEDFLNNAMLAGLGAIFGVSLVVMVRYRRIKFIIPMVLVSLSEVLIILGVSVLIGWTIDLAAIAGIIAAVGTGIDSQIIIMDQALRKEARLTTLREKLTHAFFIIFGAGGIIISTMFPLMIFGFGLLRGFAITTIIGVLAGILITRPAFGVVIEKLVE